MKFEEGHYYKTVKEPIELLNGENKSMWNSDMVKGFKNGQVRKAERVSEGNGGFNIHFKGVKHEKDQDYWSYDPDDFVEVTLRREWWL